MKKLLVWHQDDRSDSMRLQMNHWKKKNLEILGAFSEIQPFLFGLFWFGIKSCHTTFWNSGLELCRPVNHHRFAMSRCSVASSRSTCRSNDRLGNPGPGCDRWPGLTWSTPWNTKKKYTRNEYPLGNDHISHLGKRKIIDSKVPAGRGYVSSQEGSCCSWKILIACIFRGLPGKIHKGQQIRIWSNKEVL